MAGQVRLAQYFIGSSHYSISGSTVHIVESLLIKGHLPNHDT